MMKSGYQVKIACGNLQLFAGLEVSIEGEMHDMGHIQRDRVIQRRREGVTYGTQETRQRPRRKKVQN